MFAAQRPPRKRALRAHSPSELNHIEFTRWSPPRDTTYVGLEHWQGYDKHYQAHLRQQKRSFSEFQESNVQPLPTQRFPGDEDELMTDAPPPDSSPLYPPRDTVVKFTPPVGHRLQANKITQEPKSILKSRLKVYDPLPASYKPQSPTVRDLSPYIGYRNIVDEERQVKRHVGSLASAAAFSPRPGRTRAVYPSSTFNSVSNPQYRVSKPTNRARDQQASTSLDRLERFCNPQSSSVPSLQNKPLSSYQLQLLRRDPALSTSQQFTAGTTSPRQPRALSTRTTPLSDTQDLAQEDVSVATLHKSRKYLTPTSQRKNLSPLFAIPQLYPALKADIQPVQSPPPEIVPEVGTVRKIGGMFVRGLTCCLQEIYNKLVASVFGYTSPKAEEVFAIETDTSGRKRRAVAAVDMLRSPCSSSDELSTVPARIRTPVSDSTAVVEHSPPGSFPAVEQSINPRQFETHTDHIEQDRSSISIEQASASLETPPDSRPSSRERVTSFDHTPTVRDDNRQSRSSGRNQEAPLNEAQAKTNGDQQSRRNTTEQLRRRNSVLRARTTQEALELQRATLRLPKEYQTSTAVRTYEPKRPVKPLKLEARPSRQTRADTGPSRDERIENIINRTKNVTLKSREETDLRTSQRLPNERLAVQKKEPLAPQRDFKKEAEIATLEEHERFREQAKREAAERLKEETKEAAKKAKEEEEHRKKAQNRAEEQARKAAVKNQLVRPLDPEWEQKISDAMSTANPQHVIAKTPEGIELTRYDMGKILPQKDSSGRSIEFSIKNADGKSGPTGWLNDEPVNAIMSMLAERKKQQTGYVKSAASVPPYESYNTAWYKTWQDKGITGIRTWSRRKGIQGEKLLRAQKVFFPINTGAHWTLLVVLPEERKIEYLDSNSGYDATRAAKSARYFFNIAHEWLQMELGNKYNKEEWTESKVVSSQQQNFDDCGVFTCINALASAKGRSYSEVPTSMNDARKMIFAVLMNGGFKDDWEL